MTLFSGDAKARNQYMNDLAMQSALESRSLAAMQLNARTGQTVTPVTDLRSLDEKFADMELLKSRVRADLLTITDGANANSIMSSLGPAELRYVAQRFETLAKEIRPKYKMGILEPQFMQFLQEYIAADAAAPVAGRPVSASDLAAAAANAPTRHQMTHLARVGEANIRATNRVAAEAEARADLQQYVPEFEQLPPTPPGYRRKLPDAQEEARSLGLPTHFEAKSGGRGKHIPRDALEETIQYEKDRLDAEGGRPALRPGASRELNYSPLVRLNTPLHNLKANAPDTAGDMYSPVAASGNGVRFRMKGRGVNRVPLGRYSICARSLGENIVKIRSQKGAAVARYPTEKVSAKIGSLLRRMVSGGSLQFEDIQDLDNSEKRYLHKVAVGCDLVDKCPISAPKNDDVQVEQDLFTKLRGEIAAGNTNVELIKDFKKLLFKMKTEGSLPGSQVNRVLLDLLSLGH